MGGQLHNSALPSEPPPEYHLFDEETVDREEEEEVTSYSLIYPNHPDETSEMFSSIISVRSIELSESVGNVLSFQTASLVLSSDDGSSTLDEPFDTKLSSTMLF
ncbi:hypothetical protein AX774_g7439 [Zancudomyces culisetae]|uniref:Uncharacterized protein n=1 Tax=Zancudomyces culisetae TaxID=1213189 RepID=A0A1R1PE21_ZANCU|nr:hypothetical protein AX774_g7439 [Zancudomyces culisetae]|eukprot:OMH79153.1 hypothetical protein AX774_g7439 [Zancudomyces culisetae]